MELLVRSCTQNRPCLVKVSYREEYRNYPLEGFPTFDLDTPGSEDDSNGGSRGVQTQELI